MNVCAVSAPSVVQSRVGSLNCAPGFACRDACSDVYFSHLYDSAERHRIGAARSRRRSNTQWLSLLRRPNPAAGRSSLPADTVPLNENDDTGVTWAISENRFDVRSEMSNCRSDTCSPMSSSACSSNPDPDALRVLVDPAQRQPAEAGTCRPTAARVFSVVVSKVRKV